MNASLDLSAFFKGVVGLGYEAEGVALGLCGSGFLAPAAKLVRQARVLASTLMATDYGHHVGLNM